jgi:parallel beta-helix repeat protein
VILNRSGLLAFQAVGTADVTWEVDGVPGGGGASGSLAAVGKAMVYTAPSQDGAHTVTARSTANPAATASVSVTVAASCAPAPAPSPATVVNVQDPPYLAKGDGVTDDTAAIQKAVAAVGGTGGTVRVPPGTYMIDPTANQEAGIRLASLMTLALDPGATLQALPTSTSAFNVVMASGVHDAAVTGGAIVGNNGNNTITDTKEGGIGINIWNSTRVTVDGTALSGLWCDGLYVGGGCHDVTVNNVVSGGNRRSGMSVTSVSGMVVRGSTFRGSIGLVEGGVFVCGTGVDVEPNLGETVTHLQFLGCTFKENPSSGIEAGPAVANKGRAFVDHVLILGGVSSGNGFHSHGCGVGLSVATDCLVSGVTVLGTTGIGIYLRAEADGNQVLGNTVTGSLAGPAPNAGWNGTGIELYGTSGNTVTGNVITGNAAAGLVEGGSTGVNATSPNTLSGNGVAP